MRDLDFGGAPMPLLEDFEPYEYTDDNPEDGTVHHGLRYEEPGTQVAFMIEYAAPDPETGDPGGHAWYFQDRNGSSREDPVGYHDTVREAYDSMKAQFELETGARQLDVPSRDGEACGTLEEAMDKARQRAQNADRTERPQQEPGKAREPER